MALNYILSTGTEVPVGPDACTKTFGPDSLNLCTGLKLSANNHLQIRAIYNR